MALAAETTSLIVLGDLGRQRRVSRALLD